MEGKESLKSKIIVSYDLEDFENQINNFISNEYINIDSIDYSCSESDLDQSTVLMSALIIYHYKYTE